MTSVASGAARRLASFAVRSEPGNERIALARVAGAVAGTGLVADRLDRLKTAVAEATMNAIEHGNHNRPELAVDVEVTQYPAAIVVTITDQGGAPETPAEAAEQPDLARKLAGEQSPRGWGLFLIRNMVDAMDVTTEGNRRTVRLTVTTTIPADKGAIREDDLPG
jgi:anti-sigma regulatory factor (Ser/Thr protein kinase)